jgi:hypothetical protein
MSKTKEYFMTLHEEEIEIFCESLSIIKSLLNCPDLNHENLTDLTVEAIENAQQFLEEYGVK